MQTTMSTRTSDIPPAIAEEVCTLPVVCLQTANFDLSVGDIIKDKNTIIDLWTTRCTRCPAALDTLNEFAAASSATKQDDDSNVTTSIQCVSICCGDTLDGAREIIEAPAVPRWSAIQHFFMAYNDKERCKQLLLFRQVPFFIAFDRNGLLIYSGNQKMDWPTLFQEHSKRCTIIEQLSRIDSKTANVIDVTVHSPTSAISVPTTTQKLPQQQQDEIPTFVIDDMDF